MLEQGPEGDSNVGGLLDPCSPYQPCSVPAKGKQQPENPLLQNSYVTPKNKCIDNFRSTKNINILHHILQYDLFRGTHRYYHILDG